MNSSTDPRINSFWIFYDTVTDKWEWRAVWWYQQERRSAAWSGFASSYVDALRAIISVVQEHAEEVSNGSDE